MYTPVKHINERKPGRNVNYICTVLNVNTVTLRYEQ